MGHLIGDLNAHHLAPHAAFAQAFLQGNHEIVRFQFTQFQISVAGDTEEVVPLNGHAWEEQAKVEGHQLLQGQCGVEAVTAVSQLQGQLDEARQVFLWNFDPRKLLLTAFRVADQCRNVEAQVADEWKRVSRIYRQWC